MITPDAFVAHVHAGFALASRFDDRSVHLDRRLIKERIVLLFPDIHTNFVESVLVSIQYRAVVNRRQKSPAVVGSGIRSAPMESRKNSSLRRVSISCKQVPPHKALYAKLRT